MSKVVVLLSGGLDSATCLALACKENGPENVVALNMHYGQRHDVEQHCAEELAKYYRVRLISKDLSSVFTFSDSAMLADSEGAVKRQDVEYTSYAEQLKEHDIVNTYVPFRNGLFLSTAAAIAYSLEAEKIYIGAHQDDADAAYPDCTSDFMVAMDTAIAEGTGGHVLIERPFINNIKADVVAAGLELAVPYELTWSCYSPVLDEETGNFLACGRCATCRDRVNAFLMNDTTDPILYAE